MTEADRAAVWISLGLATQALATAGECIDAALAAINTALGDGKHDDLLTDLNYARTLVRVNGQAITRALLGTLDQKEAA